MSKFRYSDTTMYDQLLQHFGGRSVTTTKQTAVRNAIQSALDEVWHASYWSWRRSQMNVAVSASSLTYPLPDDFDGMVVGEFREDTSGAAVVPITDRDFIREKAADVTGEPGYYRVTWKITGSTGAYVMEFEPEPDSRYTYTGVEYWKGTPELTFTGSGTIPQMPSEFFAAWEAKAKEKVAYVMGRDEAAPAFEAAAERKLNDARRRWDTIHPSGPPRSPESAYGDEAYL